MFLLIVTFSNEVIKKACSSINKTLSGITISVNDKQTEKADAPMVFKLEGKTTVCKDWQSLNVASFIELIFASTTTDSNDIQSTKQ